MEHRKKTKENAKYYEYDYAIRDISTTEDVAIDNQILRMRLG